MHFPHKTQSQLNGSKFPFPIPFVASLGCQLRGSKPQEDAQDGDAARAELQGLSWCCLSPSLAFSGMLS